jgi:hypothetical protein
MHDKMELMHDKISYLLGFYVIRGESLPLRHTSLSFLKTSSISSSSNDLYAMASSPDVVMCFSMSG